MSTTDVKTPMREVRVRVAVFFALIMLSSDSINPVKVICSILDISTHVATMFFVASFILIISLNAKELAYFCVKVFFHSILTIFFSSMEVLGKENIPLHGPIIFTGNHMNQFVDGAVMMVTNPQRVGFLVAEKSYKTKLVGGFCKAIGSIPVARPQDNASKGPGEISFDGLMMKGVNTKFTLIGKGDRLRPGKSVTSYKIEKVISDTEAILAEEFGEPSPLVEKECQGNDKWSSYDILKYVDQGNVFGAVQKALADGQCLGIFPEGGSHDRTDLLPLKAGIAAIAFGVKDKYNVNVPIVPVGLNYYRGHKFRGRVVVEFGEPMYISKEQLSVYSDHSKREAYQSLLSDIEKGMRSVIVTAPKYSELKLIHTVRRLYQTQRLYAPRGTTGSTTKLKQDLARRFAVAYAIVEQRNGGKLPDDLLEMKNRLQEYQKTLERWGLYDYQLMSNLETSYSQLLYSFVHGLIVLVLASLPSLILNAPVGAAANYWAYKEAQKDLKASRVKLAARDVLLSKKIVFCIIAVPVLWMTYAVLLLSISSLQVKTIVVLLLCCPLFSYLGVTWVQAGIVDLKDLRPAFLRLQPEFRKVAQELPAMRTNLQKDVRALVRKYGPELGPLYFEKTDAWEQMMKADISTAGAAQSSADAAAAAEAGEEVLMREREESKETAFVSKKED